MFGVLTKLWALAASIPLAKRAQGLFLRGEFVGAEALLEESLNRLSTTVGPDHYAAIAVANNLAAVYRELGDLARCRALQEQVFESLSRSMGPDDSATLIAANNLATTAFDQGDAAGAESMIERVLRANAQEDEAVGDPNARLLMTNNLARILHGRREYERARVLLSDAFDEAKSHLGSEHRTTLLVASNLAATLRAQGDLAGAGDLYAYVLDERKKQLGAGHPDTLRLISNVAEVRSAQRDHAAAQPLMDQALEARRRALGERHPETLTSMNNLALTLQQRGDLLQAIETWSTLLISARDVREGGDVVFYMLRQCSAGVLQMAMVAVKILVSRPSTEDLRRQRDALLPSVHEVLRRLMALLPQFTAASARLQLLVEVRVAPTRGEALTHFVAFHRSWLEICCLLARERAAEPLAVLHGMEAWNVAVQEVVGRESAGLLSAPQRSFLDARRALSEIRTQIAQIDARIATLVDGVSPANRSRECEADQDPTGGLRSHLEAETAKLVAQEKGLTARYDHARELLAASDATMAAALRPDWHRVFNAARLAPDEAAAVLFSIDSGHGAAVVCGSSGGLSMVDLPLLEAARADLASHAFAIGDLWRGGGLRRGDGADLAELNSSPSSEAIAPLPTETDGYGQALWGPLRAHAPDVRRWHVVTGPGLHALALELGRSADIEARFYCGLPTFYCSRTRSAPAPQSGALALAVDPAWETMSPLPFVETEAEVVQAVLKKAGLASERRKGAALLGGQAQWVQVACHGRWEGSSGSRHGTLVLNSTRNEVLDPTSVARLPVGTAEFVATACVGGFTGHTPAGDGLGMPAALGLRGIDVVGCVAEMPDLFMPILAALYWSARAAQGLPAPQALEDARRRLRSGNWPEPVVQPLRDAYHRQMLNVLERIARLVPGSDIARRDGLLQGEELEQASRLASATLGSWCLDATERAAWGIDAPGGMSDATLQRALKDWCLTPRDRELRAQATITRLIDERHNPAPSVRAWFEYLAAFTMCWGDGGEAVAAAQST